MHFRSPVALIGALALVLVATVAAMDGGVDPRLGHPAPGEWPSDGRDYTAPRYSPRTPIDASNVSRLGLAWYDDLDTLRGVEATPIYADGVLYNSLPFNVIKAYDAKTGRVLWTYDPKVPREMARYACCEPDSRGLAKWHDLIVIATLDGRLIGLDKASGKPVWTTQVLPTTMPYTITGAPRVFGDQVVIGNSGGDLGVRGFVAAFDAATGAKRWKFFLTPNPDGKPDGEASDPIMPMVRKTWSDEGLWKQLGGGANPWDSIAYDPELKLVYVGTGNSSPHSQFYRSPGGGDNLFVCSIVALHAEDGSYAWHYQMIPGEEWDYTCTSSIVSADLKIGGKTRKVIMQAPKNGFFYVLDRVTGELISAETYVPNTWASHIDLKTGRPVELPTARLTYEPQLMTPTALASHSWHPMAYNPNTGLVYFPAHEHWMVMSKIQEDTFKYVPWRNNSGFDYVSHPEKRRELQQIADSREKGFLLAWDPVKQKEAFRVPHIAPGSGGVLTTQGNLLFQGTPDKEFVAYRADNGRLLWRMPMQNVPIAGPVTYMVDGVQYVAVNVAWGGQPSSILAGIPNWSSDMATARLVVFKLGGNVKLPPRAATAALAAPPRLTGSEAQVNEGRRLFADTCSSCHGRDARGGLKDLRWMSPDTHDAFLDVVLRGIRTDKGMASFADMLTEEQAEAIHH
jgi:quinohemoprotein ethanol dehydrogenase